MAEVDPDEDDYPTYDADDPLWALPSIAVYFVAATYKTVVQAQTIKRWAERGHISPLTEAGCYSLREIMMYLDGRSDRSHRKAVGSIRRRGETRRVACDEISSSVRSNRSTGLSETTSDDQS